MDLEREGGQGYADGREEGRAERPEAVLRKPIDDKKLTRRFAAYDRKTGEQIRRAEQLERDIVAARKTSGNLPSIKRLEQEASRFFQQRLAAQQKYSDFLRDEIRARGNGQGKLQDIDPILRDLLGRFKQAQERIDAIRHAYVTFLSGRYERAREEGDYSMGTALERGIRQVRGKIIDTLEGKLERVPSKRVRELRRQLQTEHEERIEFISKQVESLSTRLVALQEIRTLKSSDRRARAQTIQIRLEQVSGELEQAFGAFSVFMNRRLEIATGYGQVSIEQRIKKYTSFIEQQRASLDRIRDGVTAIIKPEPPTPTLASSLPPARDAAQTFLPDDDLPEIYIFSEGGAPEPPAAPIFAPPTGTSAQAEAPEVAAAGGKESDGFKGPLPSVPSPFAPGAGGISTGKRESLFVPVIPPPAAPIALSSITHAEILREIPSKAALPEAFVKIEPEEDVPNLGGFFSRAGIKRIAERASEVWEDAMVGLQDAAKKGFLRTIFSTRRRVAFAIGLGVVAAGGVDLHVAGKYQHAGDNGPKIGAPASFASPSSGTSAPASSPTPAPKPPAAAQAPPSSATPVPAQAKAPQKGPQRSWKTLGGIADKLQSQRVDLYKGRAEWWMADVAVQKGVPVEQAVQQALKDPASQSLPNLAGVSFSERRLGEGTVSAYIEDLLRSQGVNEKQLHEMRDLILGRFFVENPTVNGDRVGPAHSAVATDGTLHLKLRGNPIAKVALPGQSTVSSVTPDAVPLPEQQAPVHESDEDPNDAYEEIQFAKDTGSSGFGGSIHHESARTEERSSATKYPSAKAGAGGTSGPDGYDEVALSYEFSFSDLAQIGPPPFGSVDPRKILASPVLYGLCTADQLAAGGSFDAELSIADSTDASGWHAALQGVLENYYRTIYRNLGRLEPTSRQLQKECALAFAAFAKSGKTLRFSGVPQAVRVSIVDGKLSITSGDDAEVYVLGVPLRSGEAQPVVMVDPENYAANGVEIEGPGEVVVEADDYAALGIEEISEETAREIRLAA